MSTEYFTQLQVNSRNLNIFLIGWFIRRAIMIIPQKYVYSEDLKIMQNGKKRILLRFAIPNVQKCNSNDLTTYLSIKRLNLRSNLTSYTVITLKLCIQYVRKFEFSMGFNGFEIVPDEDNLWQYFPTFLLRRPTKILLFGWVTYPLPQKKCIDNI